MTYPTIRPVLTLDFAKSRQLDPRIAFTRSSIATYIHPDTGLITTVPDGVARFEEDGLLIEEARTNLLLNSATLATQTVTVTANEHTLSFYGTGTVTLSGASTSGPLVGTGSDERVELSFTPTAGSLTLTISGSVTDAQLEAGSFSTSYIPTTSSTVTRAADVATISTANIFGDTFTTINKDFGTAGGSDTLSIVGTDNQRTVVYEANLTQTQINAVATAEDNDYWMWRVLGSSFRLNKFATDGEVTVDWGDGTVETMTTAEHTFTNGGGYHDIGFKLVSGTYFRPQIDNNSTHKDKVIAVGPAPASMIVNGVDAFFSCTNLVTFDATANFNGGTNLENAFRGNSSLKSFPLIDTSSVTSFSATWFGCSSLTSFPLIDTSAGNSTFTNAWKNCSSLTSFPQLDLSSATTFGSTWDGCSSLTSFPQIDFTSATSVKKAWQGCNSLTSFPSVDISSCKTFEATWRNCNGLTSFPANFFDDWSPASVTNKCFYQTWDGCNSLPPASVVNILDSIAASGVSAPSGTGTVDKRIQIDWDGTGTPGTTAAASITTLKSRNWDIYLNNVQQ